MTDDERLLRLPFDLYGRCRLAADAIEQIAAGRSLSVVDVGGGPHSVAAFMPDADVVTVDRHLPPAGWYDLPDRFVLADGAALPLPDDAVDVAVSLDTLEHVPADSRGRLLDELTRVSRGWVLAACPCATDGVADADRALLAVVERKFGSDFPTVSVLREHLGYGHPVPGEVEAALRARGAEVVRLPSGRLDRWLPMMLVFFHLMGLGDDEPVEQVQAWYNARFARADRAAPAYRQAFLARLPGAEGPDPGELAASLADDSPAAAGPQTATAAPGDPGLAAVRAVLEHPLVELAEARRRRVEELEARLPGQDGDPEPAAAGRRLREALRPARQRLRAAASRVARAATARQRR